MPALRFQRLHISDERYESAAAFDVNNDGVLDIVSGAYWYPGPKYDKKCKVGPVKAEGEYFDDFSTIPLDVNGDGYLDFVTGGWWGNNIRWRENPKGDPKQPWVEHVIAETGNVETTRGWDVDGCGTVEICPNTPGAPLKFYKLIKDANGKGTGAFSTHQVTAKGVGHGLGFGDVDGCGRGEFITPKGILKVKGDPLTGAWEFSEEFDLGSASVPILVVDVNGDGLMDLIVGQAHRYGLDWWEQRREGGQRKWVKHPIDPFNSQYHDLIWADIDGDGQCELITGKRYRAHCGRDAGEYDNYGLYYFKWTGENFAKQVIDFGAIPFTKGCGIYFQVVDLDGDGKLDILAPGKDGLCWFKNLGFAENMGD